MLLLNTKTESKDDPVFVINIYVHKVENRAKGMCMFGVKIKGGSSNIIVVLASD